MIERAIPATARQIIAIDCSFIPKSGKATYGIEHFYNGSAGRTEKGLEISVLAIVDVEAKQGYTLSVQQTPPTSPVTKANPNRSLFGASPSDISLSAQISPLCGQ